MRNFRTIFPKFYAIRYLYILRIFREIYQKGYLRTVGEIRNLVNRGIVKILYLKLCLYNICLDLNFKLAFIPPK